MSGVLIRIYIPTSKYEREIREGLKTKCVPQGNSSVTSNTEEISTDTLKDDSSTPHVSKTLDEVDTTLKEVVKKLSTSSAEINELQDELTELKEPDKSDNVPLKSILKNDRNSSYERSQNVSKESEDWNVVDYEDMPMEKALRKILQNMNIVTAVWCHGDDSNYFQVMFSMDNDSVCEDILHMLEDCDIGSKLNSIVSVTPCLLHYQGAGDSGGGQSEDGETQDDEKTNAENASEWNNFLASIRARLTVAQVIQGVKSGANLTFDFLALLLVAGFLSALGLVENSTVILVASMLISPLMGPILAGTFGTMIQDRFLQRMGFRNELLGLLICLLIGFLFGFLISLSTDKWGDGDWPTQEMTARGKVRSLWVGVLIALFSGAAVAIATLADYTGSLVGVAISASLLPPAVNAGLLWSIAFTDLIKGSTPGGNNTAYDGVYSNDRPADLAILGTVSMGLTLLNIVCIFLAGIFVLKIKAVAPRTSQEQHRFWKYDVKMARDNNWTWKGEDARELGRRLLSEHTGISPDEFELGQPRRRGKIPWRYSQEFQGFTPYSLGPGRSQLTWSPSTTALNRTDRLPSIQELELLYRTLTNTNIQKRPSLRLRRMSTGGRWLGSPGPLSPQTKSASTPVSPAADSAINADGFEVSFKGPTVLSMEPPKRPQRGRTARFVVTPAEDPIKKV